MKIMLLTLILMFSVSSYASGGFGLGVMLINPTGFSANYKLNRKASIDGALSFDLSGNGMSLHSTYLWKKPRSLRVEDIKLGWFFGAGGAYKNKSKDDDSKHLLGARAAAGLDYTFPSVPVELFGELSLFVSSETDFGIGLGARYYFN